MTIRRGAAVVWSGILGGLFCLAAAAAANLLALTPNFPAFAGEDDFAFRFAIFGGMVLPSFVALGAWVGHRALTHERPWWRTCLGAAVGTAVAFGTTRLLAAQIEALPSRRASNSAVVAFFLGWVVLAAVGVILTFKRSPPTRSSTPG